MSIREKMKEQLEESGLWPNEADAVMTRAEAAPMLACMKDHWTRDAATYLPSLFVVTWISVKAVAIDYLKETAPQHFALAVLQG